MNIREINILVNAKMKIDKDVFEDLSVDEKDALRKFMKNCNIPTKQELRKYDEYKTITTEIIQKGKVVSDITLFSIIGYINQFEDTYLNKEDK